MGSWVPIQADGKNRKNLELSFSCELFLEGKLVKITLFIETCYKLFLNKFLFLIFTFLLFIWQNSSGLLFTTKLVV